MERLTQQLNEYIEENSQLKLKIIELENNQEIKELKIENVKLRKQISILQQNNSILEESNFMINKKENGSNCCCQSKYELEKANKKFKDLSEIYEIKHKKSVDSIQNIVKMVLGYQIRVEDNEFELLSMYAFDRSDVFVIKFKNSTTFEFLENEFYKEYEEIFKKFVVEMKCIPAFFAHVTMELACKSTFG